MIRAVCLAALLAGPAGAEGAGLCAKAWQPISDGMNSVTGARALGTVGQDGDWCVISDLVIDMPGDYAPDWHLDRLKVRGSALAWIADGSSLPEGLEVAVEGLRLVVQTGNPQMDWLLAAQSRPNGIDAEASLSWDPAGKVLRLEGLTLDFPGENRIEGSAVVTGVDLSSRGAMQMSATGFSLTEAELNVQMHGLFETYALMALGSVLLPPEGDMDAAAERLRAKGLALVADLPGTSFSDASKAALSALIGELPNPSGALTLSVRADPGIGPQRLAPWLITGVPRTLAAAAALFQGVTVDVGWTHDDVP